MLLTPGLDNPRCLLERGAHRSAPFRIWVDSDWSNKNKKQPGFLRLISAWYAMVLLHSFWHHENYDSHMPEVTGWSPVATVPRMQQRPVGGCDGPHAAIDSYARVRPHVSPIRFRCMRIPLHNGVAGVLLREAR